MLRISGEQAFFFQNWRDSQARSWFTCVSRV